MGDGKYIVNMFSIGRVFGEQRGQCCSGGGEVNDGDRVVPRTSYGEDVVVW